MTVQATLQSFAGTTRKVSLKIRDTKIYYLGTVLGLDNTFCVLQQVKPNTTPDKIPLVDIESVTESFVTDMDIMLSFSK